MSDSHLPNINLEFLRKQAKALLKLARSGDPAALERLRVQLPKLALPADIKLADAQHALAKEQGFPNWSALKRSDDPVERFLSAVRSGSLRDSRRELAGFPELADESIHAACAVGDPDAVRNHLDLDPGSLTAEHKGWPPLFYCCSTPLNRATSRQSAGILECARLLLDRGADPNTGALTNPSDPETAAHAVVRAVFSANMPVVTLLMQRGAKLDLKQQASRMAREQPMMTDVYREYLSIRPVQEAMPKRVEELRQQGKLWGSDRWWFHARPEIPAIAINLHRMLLEKGMDPNKPAGEGATVFHNVVRNGTVEIVELYLEHGAAIDAPTADGRTPLVLAIRGGRNLVVDALRRRGASEIGLRPIDELLGACVRTDEPDAFAILGRYPAAAEQASADEYDVLVQAAAMNVEAQVRILARCGFDLGAFSENGLTALHAAAWHGHPGMVRLLVGLHAPVNIRDRTYGSSPLAWAAHGSKNCRADDDAYIQVVQLLKEAGATYEGAISRSGVRPESLATERVAAAMLEFKA